MIQKRPDNFIASPPDTIYVRVEQRHIDAGECSRAHSCAIARALREKYGGWWAVTGLQAYQYDDAGKPRAVYDLPMDAQRWVFAYDSCVECDPITFSAKRFA